MTSDPTLADGSRQDLTADFVTRRTIDTPAGPVQRLLVAAEEKHHSLLVDPDRPGVHGLRTGDRYRFDGVLGWFSPGPSEPPGDGLGCTGMNPWVGDVDVPPWALEVHGELDSDATVGVLDDRTTVTAVTEVREGEA